MSIWKSIETAPKDGSVIILGYITNQGNMMVFAKWNDNIRDGGWENPDDSSFIILADQPSFWTEAPDTFKFPKKLTDEQTLATALHEKFCHHSHTDGCDWLYDSWEVPLFAKSQYLRKAQTMLKIVSLPIALKIVECL